MIDTPQKLVLQTDVESEKHPDAIVYDGKTYVFEDRDFLRVEGKWVGCFLYKEALTLVLDAGQQPTAQGT